MTNKPRDIHGPRDVHHKRLLRKIIPNESLEVKLQNFSAKSKRWNWEKGSGK